MSATIYIRINGVHDNIQLAVSENTTIGYIKDQIIMKGHAVDRSQIRLAHLGYIITSDLDNIKLFSIDNCSFVKINGKTIHAIIDKWSDEKIAQYKEMDKSVDNPENEDMDDYEIICNKIKTIANFVMNVDNKGLVTALYNNGVNKFIDDILTAFGQNSEEILTSTGTTSIDDIKPENTPVTEEKPVIDEAHIEKDKKIFAIQLKTLEDMGFQIVERNIEVLKLHNGSSESAINYFLDNGY